MKTSIAMATYNGEKYILEQLESFAKQTVLPNELVITDDCSSDKTVEKIREFSINAPFEIKLIVNEKNLGFTQNFNKALQLCRNEIVFLSDQDDVWFPSKIECILNLSKKYPDKDVFLINAELVSETLEKSGLTIQDQVKGLQLKDYTFMHGACCAVKKSYLDLVLPIPNNYVGHDGWICIISEMMNVKYIDSSIQQYYRIHDNNTSNFNANSLVKTEKTRTPLKKKIFRWSRGSKANVFSNHILKQKNFLVPLNKLSEKELYTQRATEKIYQIVKDIEAHEKRLKVIKSKTIISRIWNGFNLYINKGYEPFNGYKSLISDIIYV